MPLKYFIAIALGIFLGINIAYSLNFSTEIFFVSLVICFINFLIFKFFKKNSGKEKSETPIFLSILFLSLAFGIILGQISISKSVLQKERFNNFISQKENFIGLISNVKQSEKSQQLILKIKNEDNDFKIKIVTAKFPEFKVGEFIKVEGKIGEGKILLPNTENKINKSFDLEIQDKLKNIDGEIAFPKILTIENLETKVSLFEKFSFYLQNQKSNFVKKLDTLAPRVVASLTAGTTLGDDSLFSKEEINNFRISGLSHIIVLSGFNITILIVFFSFLFLNLNLRLKLRIFLTLVSIIIFIIFVGAEPSILRAAIMGGVLLLGNISGRQYVAKQALFLAALFMMILNPKIAVFDISFHLSFLATFGILYLLPIFDEYKFFSQERFKNKFAKNLLEIFKLTLAVQILVSPYIIFKFSNLSLFGIVGNLLVVPVIPIIMFLAFLIILFSFLPGLSIFFGYLSFIFSKYIFLVVEFISSFSFSKLDFSISSLEMFLIYFLIIFYLSFEKKRIKIQKYLKEEK
ncbi:hypothetical protein SDC9_21764 [bioreactor metagenome]|uniref:ComEC/Rec2-related protein domain-containing protein n=1 Tax=bioreactor metagenome TaxID=1076179 RepID=A0A644UAC6_9ZZZZ|nr:ComEC/Rec2 family competence protein [Candidatus Elulimicrobiales bacterium]